LGSWSNANPVVWISRSDFGGCEGPEADIRSSGAELLEWMMTKAYLTQWLPRKKQDEKHWSDFALDDDTEKAAHWDSKEQADIDCRLLNGMNVEIDSPDGIQHYLCKDFAVEERAQDKFAAFCMLPW
jgi:hypothetical protein